MALLPPYIDLPKTGRVDLHTAARLLVAVGASHKGVNLHEFRRGLEVEREHADVIGNDAIKTARIAMAHLREVPNYYTKLKKVEGHSLGVVDNEKHVESYKRPKALSGSAKKQADALVRTFDDWFQTYSDGWPDCQHISTVVGQALEKLGHQVEVIGGDAYASDSQEEGIHYWLHIDGRFYDPKWVLLKQDDPSFSYSRHNGAWIWDVQTALNNAVEECPVLRPPKK